MVSKLSCAESTSAMIVSPVFTLDESASLLSPRPVLNSVTLFVVEVAVNLNLTVVPDMLALNVPSVLDPVCVTPY